MRTTWAHHGAIFLALAALCELSGCGRAPDDPVTRYEATLPLTGSSPAEFRRELDAGSWLVELQEDGIDVRADLALEGATTRLRNSATRQGRFYQVMVVPVRSELRVTITSQEHETVAGRIRLRLARFRRGLADPATKLEASFAAASRAARETALETPESWKAAEQLWRESIALFEKSGDVTGYAWASFEHASLLNQELDDYQAASRVADDAARAFRRVGDDFGTQLATQLGAAIDIDLAGTLDAATEHVRQKALHEAAENRLAGTSAYFLEHGSAGLAVTALILRGASSYYRGAEETAAERFTQALRIARAHHDGTNEITALMNLAWLHRLNGEVALATEEYARLLPMINAQTQAYLYAAALTNYGFCATAVGDFDRALQLHTEALGVFKRLGEKSESATQVLALAGLYYRMGDARRALETSRIAIGEFEAANDSDALGNSLRRAGIAASALGEHHEALDYLRRSVRSNISIANNDRTRVLIAGELRALGKLDDAERELRQPLQSPNILVRTTALAERGRVRLARGSLAEALTDMQAADAAYAGMEMDSNRIDNKVALSQALLLAKDATGARSVADQAIALVARLRTRSGNPEWRAQFLSASYLPYEARIAAEFAGDGPPDGHAWRAFRLAEEIRGRSLADLRARGPRGAKARDPVADDLRSRVSALQTRLESRLQSGTPEGERDQALRRSLIETRAQFDAHQAKVAAIATTSAALPASLAAFQSGLPADTAVLAYFVGDSQSHGWLIHRDGIRHAPLPGRARIESLVARFNGNRARGVRHSGNDIVALTGGLLADVRQKRLLILPDGALNGLPFAAIPVSPGSPSLLVDRFVISTASSLELMLPAKRRKAAGLRIAVVADPVYSREDRRLPRPAGGAREVRGLGGDGVRLARLPYAAREADSVMNAFPHASVIRLAGFDATAARVLQLPSTDLDVLHFATHADARRDLPLQSALFLSGFSESGGRVDDNRLSADDIARVGLHADLVVLSGCATGDGRELRGEGVLGLAYSFMANGARTVVASLWPVEDAPTAKLMEEFYVAYRDSGDAADALRRAQLRVRQDASPDVWSSFVVRTSELR